MDNLVNKRNIEPLRRTARRALLFLLVALAALLVVGCAGPAPAFPCPNPSSSSSAAT